MNNHQNKYHKCKYSETTWFLVIAWIAIVVSLLTVIAVAYLGHRSFNNALNTTVSNTTSISSPENSNNIIKITDENSFVGRIIGFYETVITIFSLIIGFVLTIGFIYLRNVSKSEVCEAVREEIDADFFKSYLKEQLENVFKSDAKDGILKDIIEDQSEIIETIKEKYEAIKTIKNNIEKMQLRMAELEKIIDTPSETGDNNNNNTVKIEAMKKDMEAMKLRITELKETVVALQETIETTTSWNEIQETNGIEDK